MDVIHMTCEVIVVAYLVFPIAALPYAAFAFLVPARADVLGSGQLSRESGFDQRPSGWVIGVAERQRPNDMNVFRQHDHGIDMKRMRIADSAYAFSQFVDVVGKQRFRSVGQVDGKEERTAWSECTSIGSHGCFSWPPQGKADSENVART